MTPYFYHFETLNIRILQITSSRRHSLNDYHRGLAKVGTKFGTQPRHKISRFMAISGGTGRKIVCVRQRTC